MPSLRETCPSCPLRKPIATPTSAVAFWSRPINELHTMGDRVQASDKASGAVAQAVKAIAEDRNWRHRSHNLRRDIVGLLADEFQQPQMRHLQAIADQLHDNYYEDWLGEALVTDSGCRRQRADTPLVASAGTGSEPGLHTHSLAAEDHRPPASLGRRSPCRRKHRLAPAHATLQSPGGLNGYQGWLDRTKTRYTTMIARIPLIPRAATRRREQRHLAAAPGTDYRGRHRRGVPSQRRGRLRGRPGNLRRAEVSAARRHSRGTIPKVRCPSRLSIAVPGSMRYRETARKLSWLGCYEVTKRGGGSHRRWFNPGTR